MTPSDWIDSLTVPPRPLPGGLDDAIEYLSSSLGMPVYTRWTPASLAARYPSMQQAKAALPEVFSQLLEADAVVQFWELGQVVTLPCDRAPGPGTVVERLLRALRVRFRPAHAFAPAPDDPATHARANRRPARPAAPAIDAEPWLAGSGRFLNSNPSTRTLSACEDAAAVRLFMQERAANPHTRRAYAAEIRRLIHWCQSNGVMGPLSGLTRDTLISYGNALCGETTHTPGASHDHGASERRALAVLRSLFSYLSATGYLISNPAARLGDTAAAREKFTPERILPRAAVRACDNWLRAHLDHNDPRPGDARRAAIVAVYRFSGIRVDELAQHDGYPRVAVDDEGWTLTVMGKGRKKRSIPLPDVCVVFLMRYRLACGLPAIPCSGENRPLINGKRGGHLGASGLYREVKTAFSEMAQSLPHADAGIRPILQGASPHWLRHLAGKTLAVDEQVPLPLVQAILGHASVVTTAGYCRADLSGLRQVMQRSFRLSPDADS